MLQHAELAPHAPASLQLPACTYSVRCCAAAAADHDDDDHAGDGDDDDHDDDDDDGDDDDADDDDNDVTVSLPGWIAVRVALSGSGQYRGWP